MGSLRKTLDLESVPGSMMDIECKRGNVDGTYKEKFRFWMYALADEW
jgi:hypothetical protein